MKREWKLIATAQTVDGIEKLINEFYFSTRYSVHPQSLEILHDGKPVNNQAMRIVMKKERFRFEIAVF